MGGTNTTHANGSNTPTTVTEPDIVATGIYGQYATYGVYLGWNDNKKGVEFGGFQQTSAGVASYASGGVVISWSDGWLPSIELTGNIGGGIAPPTGVPIGPVTGAAWVNVDGTKGAQLGLGLTDLLEAGFYSQVTTQEVPATPLNSSSFWNNAIRDVQTSNAPASVKAAILRDLALAREIPAYRQEIGEKYGLVDPLCFPASTPIAISATETRPISDIRVGDTVLAFDPSEDLGRGALVPRKVVRLYRNTTDEWVRLTWEEDGEAKELIATPGHHFLDRFGSFPTIEEMLENGKATVVLASGELTEVTADRIVYSAETAHLFEQTQAVGMVAGNTALKPATIDAWQTYNFEVEDLHTYVAGGVRVHNSSGILGKMGDTIDAALDKALNFAQGTVGQLFKHKLGGNPFAACIDSGQRINALAQRQLPQVD